MTSNDKKKLPKGISLRTGGKYEARFTTKYGKRISKTFTDLPEAKHWLAKSKLEDEAIGFQESMTLNEWKESWFIIKEASIRKSTLKTYEHACSKIPPWLLRMDINKIKPFHIQKMFNELSDGFSKKSMMSYKTVISGMFQQAYNNELISRNPVRGSVTIPKSGKQGAKRKKFLTKIEQNKITKALQQKPCEKNRLFEFVMQTGLRASEVISLTWDNVDFNNKLLYIKAQLSREENGDYKEGELKTENSIRTIPLTEEAIRILKEQKTVKRKMISIQYADVVFLSKNGIPFNISYLDRQLSNVALRAEIPHISLHTLRHTFATRCAEAKVPLKVLQRVMGHANIQTTMDIYVHASDDALQEGMTLFEKHMENSIRGKNGDKMAMA